MLLSVAAMGRDTGCRGGRQVLLCGEREHALYEHLCLGDCLHLRGKGGAISFGGSAAAVTGCSFSDNSAVRLGE